mgnify:CR=1 FL=1|jgi:hypothetical protein
MCAKKEKKLRDKKVQEASDEEITKVVGGKKQKNLGNGSACSGGVAMIFVPCWGIWKDDR